MTHPGANGDDLAGAFARRSGRSLPPGCPPAERLWDAVDGRLPPHELEAVVEHTVACAACAEDWRLALDLRRELGAEAARTRPGFPWRRWLPVAAAAVLLLAVGVSFRFGGSPPEPAYRATSEADLRSLVPEDLGLPRDRFLLRWSAAAAEARYNVVVSDQNLDEVARARGLTEPRYLVPRSALADFPGGTRLLWQVEVLRPDGERRLSPTFFARLE